MSWPQSAEPSAGAGAAPRRQLSLEKLRAYFERRRFDRDERKRLLAEVAEQRRLLETTAETAPIAAEMEPETETAAPAPVVAEGPYSIPSIDLLNPADPPDPAANNDDLEANRRIIQDTLDSFGIDAEVGNATRGPRVTLFEINVARGVKVEAISNIVNNLAMELKAISLRVLTPVPGQNFVGLEVPNRISTKIAIGELLGGRLWKTSRAGIPLPLGRNIRGRGCGAGPGEGAASADRRRHRQRQIGLSQCHSDVDHLPVSAGGSETDPGRSESG
jgi:DNA segregation ATPase FtsK/SpoIIIE-like protein